MLTIEKTETYGWEAAIRGMRNPYNSWDLSDSIFSDDGTVVIGDKDRKLMERLCKAGDADSKFRRMIMVSMDITAPLFWWKQWDTYKVGTVANSCSTMHSIMSRPLTLNDFSTDDMSEGGCAVLFQTIDALNDFIYKFRMTPASCSGAKNQYFRDVIGNLPDGYNQRRTVMCSYQVLRNMYKKRRDHRLSEWRDLCHEFEKLPLADILICTAVEGEA